MEAGRSEWRTELRLSIRNLLMVPHPWLLLTQVSEAELGRGRLGPVWSRAGSLHFPARPVYWNGAAAMSSLLNSRSCVSSVCNGIKATFFPRSNRKGRFLGPFCLLLQISSGEYWAIGGSF